MTDDLERAHERVATTLQAMLDDLRDDAAADVATIAELLRARARERSRTSRASSTTPAASGWAGPGPSTATARRRRRRGPARRRASQPGDHVMLLIAEVDVAVATLFGVWALGAVPIFVGLPYRLDDIPAFVAELRRTARRLDARTLVVSDAFAALVDGGRASPRVLAAGGLQARAARRREPWQPVDPDAPALIQLTSGSTGHPRGVVLSHRAVAREPRRDQHGAARRRGRRARSRGCRCTTTWG